MVNNCEGCHSYAYNTGPYEKDCTYSINDQKECPCGLCSSKVICNNLCERFWEHFEIDYRKESS